MRLSMLWKHGRFRVEEFPLEDRFTIPAGGEVSYEVIFPVPQRLSRRAVRGGLRPVPRGLYQLVNGKPVRTEVAAAESGKE